MSILSIVGIIIGSMLIGAGIALRIKWGHW